MRGLSVLTLPLCLVAATCGDNQRQPVLPPRLNLQPVKAPADLGQRAYDHVAKVVGFGPRWPGSPGGRQALDYISDELRRATGREPVRDAWRDANHGLDLENVHVTLPGKSPHRLVLACHHDTKKCADHTEPEHNFHFVGANDSGSGVGLLLALAKELAAAERAATLQLVFFDGEESVQFHWNEQQALFGSKRFVEQDQARPPVERERSAIRAMVLLDMVGARDLQIDEETWSDPKLRDIFRSAAEACGHARYFFQARRAVGDDHLPFLRAGIPAIDLIDICNNPQWHTPDDTLEHIAAESMQIVGEVVLTALPAIEALHFADQIKPTNR